MTNETNSTLSYGSRMYILERAFKAHARNQRQAGYGHQHPSSSRSDVHTLDGRTYAVLANINGIISVYRVSADGALTGLKDWPEELAEL